MSLDELKAAAVAMLDRAYPAASEEIIPLQSRTARVSRSTANR